MSSPSAEARRHLPAPEPVRLTIPSDCLRASTVSTLFQCGVRLEIDGRPTIREYLTSDLGLDPTYVETQIATVFLDGMVVDDLDRACLHPGGTLTLSAAMPGLVGATLRRGGFYKAMRSEISWSDDAQEAVGEGTGAMRTVTVKLFNSILRDAAPRLLERGIVLTADEARGLLAAVEPPVPVPAGGTVLLQTVPRVPTA